MSIIHENMKPVIETKRLILREFFHCDIESLAVVLSDQETMIYYPHPFSIEEVRKWIEWNIKNYQKYNHGLWAVILKENNEIIGDCGITIQNIEGQDLPEIGYHINKKYWNMGYASEAAKACIEYGFYTCNYTSIYSYTDIRNGASRKVAEKIGMSFQKIFMKNVMGNDIEEVLYRIDDI